LKKLVVFFACLSVMAAWGLQCSYGAETVVINQSFNNREIKIKIGGRIRVELQTPANTANVWTLKDFDSEHLKALDPPSAGTWLFATQKAGKANLRFILSPSGNGSGNAGDAFSLRVLIIPNTLKR
jgi:hypothetical protein